MYLPQPTCVSPSYSITNSSQGSAASNVTRGYVVLNGVKREPVVADASPPAETRPLWFVMTGMGAQWHEMGKDMLKYETFRR